METMNIPNPIKKFGSGAKVRVSAKAGLECEVKRWDSLECI